MTTRRHHRLTRALFGCAATLLAATGIASTLGQATATAETPCTAVDLVVARGTTEPGWLGAEVGDPLYETLQSVLPSISAYRVNYPADYTFALGAASADIVDHITRQATACPGQRYVLVGYSQGAAGVHTALGSPLTHFVPGATRLPDELADRIAAVELFGDLGNNLGITVPAPYADRTKSFCRPGDPICWRGGQFWPAHIAYGDDITAAASWLLDQLQ
ncbi:cutinase family protein [Nocardia wallacei]|uniref:cutinase family protein n=1 Tax=Nocardia wallacei TaxID=480035 RepID=UPI0024558CC1|nr:cutinase family protein [Nocardia wallacei]